MSKLTLEFLKTIKTKADGTSATVTATLKGSSLMTIAPLLIYQFREARPREDANAITEERNAPPVRQPPDRP